MIRKISVALLGVTVALFAVDRVEGFVTHGQFGGVAAWAQSWDDGSGDAAQTDAVPEAKMVPNVSGDWSGTIDDAQFGAGSIDLTISQNAKHLSGPWDSSFGDGNFTGTVKANGDVKFVFHVTGVGSKGCHLNASGMLVSANEAQGVYKVLGCKGSNGDHGTFDVVR